LTIATLRDVQNSDRGTDPTDPAEGCVVSVVVPVGDIDPTLAEQLTALAAQTLAERWELVLAANRPRLAVDHRWAELLAGLDPERIVTRVVDASQVRSASYARNTGAAAATGSLLVFCDGDDVAAAGWLAEMVAALRSHPFVGGALDEDSLGVPGQEHWRPPATPGALPCFLGHPYVVSANLGITRELFDQLGGFDQDLIRGEDMALSFAATSAGVVLVFVPDAVVAYRHRRGLRSLLQQHYLYGWGMSQIIARGGMPGGERGGQFRANAQPVERRTWVHKARRVAIAAGRVRGLVGERLAGVRSAPR